MLLTLRHMDTVLGFECVMCVQDAAAQACSMLFLPECFSFIGVNQKEVRAGIVVHVLHLLFS